MAVFNNSVITELGQALMAKIVAGTANPDFTFIKTSDYEYVGGTNFEALTTLESIQQSTTVASVAIVDSTTVKVSGSFSNSGLVSGYYVRNIGLYANDPEEGEILYSITTATTPDWMPADVGTSSSSIQVDLNTNVSNSSNVSLTVDPSAFVTVSTLNDHKDDTATTDTLGHVKVDNSTITISNGIISASIEAKETVDRTIYVDGTLGTDANGYGGSSGAGAFASIQYAVDSVAKTFVNNATVTINVAAGTYLEEVVIDGFFGHGQVKITSSSGATCNLCKATGNSLQTSSGSGVYMSKISTSGHYWLESNSSFILLGTIGASQLIAWRSPAVLSSCNFTGADYGIECRLLSRVFAMNCTIHGSAYGIRLTQGGFFSNILGNTITGGTDTYSISEGSLVVGASGAQL